MTPLEAISEKLRTKEPWVDTGGVHWLSPGDMKRARACQGDE